jgi:hypothetical protein
MDQSGSSPTNDAAEAGGQNSTAAGRTLAQRREVRLAVVVERDMLAVEDPARR